MSLQSCYECGKEISSKAIMCPQCGAPQNPVSGLIDKTKRFFTKWKEEKQKEKEEKQKELKLLKELKLDKKEYFLYIVKVLLILSFFSYLQYLVR
jgi:hypothetical protein